FAPYSANRGHRERNTVRTIDFVRIKCRKALIEIDVRGDGFLYKMVRMIVGELVRCGTSRVSAEQIAAQLSAGKSERSGPRLVAAAAGLYLLRVRY
ncbi:MAG: tRNA pseudouridine(38-40) synthase TruA, partial [Chthoniobacterales bacterium]|nr:tRNA pseudouridine(38-40) synthase TruA [Chthoniobacterales bacterium]